MKKIAKIHANFQISFSPWRGGIWKKLFWDVFFRIHPFCLHAKFQVSYSTPSRFFFLNYIFLYHICRKICGFTPAQKFHQNSTKNDWMKATFFYLSPLIIIITIISNVMSRVHRYCVWTRCSVSWARLGRLNRKGAMKR